MISDREDTTTYKEHLQWCKDRALEILKTGSVTDAWGSMCSDMQKHPETRNHLALELGLLQMMGGMLRTPAQMREYIEGFN